MSVKKIVVNRERVAVNVKMIVVNREMVAVSM